MPVLLTDNQVAEGRDRIRRVAERQVVERGGIEQVSMHSIAQELGWSATALYRYYTNKEAILAATRSAALDRLSRAIEDAMAGPGDIWARSREVGNVYVDFAFENPDAYRLIFALSQPDASLYPELAEASSRARRNLTRYVEQMVEEGGLDADPNLLGHVFWAGLHGVISLQMAGKLGPDAPSFDTIRREMVRRIVHSARTSPRSKETEARE
jgi:AcrR family transcriptional regulator